MFALFVIYTLIKHFAGGLAIVDKTATVMEDAAGFKMSEGTQRSESLWRSKICIPPSFWPHYPVI